MISYCQLVSSPKERKYNFRLLSNEIISFSKGGHIFASICGSLGYLRLIGVILL